MNHPLMTQLELALTDNGSCVHDVAFTHRSFCIAGLPIRRPAAHDGLTANYLRKGDGFDLHLMTPNQTIPNTDIVVPIGVPYGPKARLLVIWLASEAKKGRKIEIGAVETWLREVGIGLGGHSRSLTKEQLIRLCFTMFKITVRDHSSDRDVTYFDQRTFVETGAIETEDLLHYRDGRMDKVRWPLGVILTEKAWNSFNQETVPISKTRLREIASSAPAIDIFLYMAYKLPLLKSSETHVITWQNLSKQFGGMPGVRLPTSKVKENLGSALEAVRRAYPEAKFDVTDTGLVLHHSRPPDFTPMISLSGCDLPAPNRKRNRINHGEFV